MSNLWIDSHNDTAPTLAGLRHALQSMRWNDLEAFVQSIEVRRVGEFLSSKRRLTAEMVFDWAENGAEEE